MIRRRDVALHTYQSHMKIFSQVNLLGMRGMAFNCYFNNISNLSWRSVLLVQETGIHDKRYQILMLYRVHLAKSGIRTHVSGNRHLMYR